MLWRYYENQQTVFLERNFASLPRPKFTQASLCRLFRRFKKKSFFIRMKTSLDKRHKFMRNMSEKKRAHWQRIRISWLSHLLMSVRQLLSQNNRSVAPMLVIALLLVTVFLVWLILPGSTYGYSFHWRTMAPLERFPNVRWKCPPQLAWVLWLNWLLRWWWSRNEVSPVLCHCCR